MTCSKFYSRHIDNCTILLGKILIFIRSTTKFQQLPHPRQFVLCIIVGAHRLCLLTVRNLHTSCTSRFSTMQHTSAGHPRQSASLVESPHTWSVEPKNPSIWKMPWFAQVSDYHARIWVFPNLRGSCQIFFWSDPCSVQILLSSYLRYEGAIFRHYLCSSSWPQNLEITAGNLPVLVNQVRSNIGTRIWMLQDSNSDTCIVDYVFPSNVQHIGGGYVQRV